jgi:peptidoglycan/LPS O-acetylase OafA/YrhL
MRTAPSSTLTYGAYQARGYVPELDGVRALSVLLVISVHLYDAGRVWHWLGGGQGVAIFFLLSGYLITTLALREEGRRGAVSLAAFYVRRGMRIFPLYYFTLGLYALLLLGLGFAPHLRNTFVEALPYYLLYLQEIPFYTRMIGEGADLPFFQSWSLGIEEKFYLLWPLLAFVVWRSRPAVRRAGTAALTLAFALLPPALVWLHPELRLLARCLTSYGPILAGCLLALLLHDRRWFKRLSFLASRTATAVALVLFLTVHFARPWLPEGPVPFGGDILYTLTTSILLVSILLGEGLLPRALRTPSLVHVGKLSYGIYLIHVLCIVVAHKLAPPDRGLAVSVLAYLLACGLSVAAAWVLAVVLERPCIDWGRRWSRRLLGPAAEFGKNFGLTLTRQRVGPRLYHAFGFGRIQRGTDDSLV